MRALLDTSVLIGGDEPGDLEAATFDPLPITTETTRLWGSLAAAVARRGGKPRRRQLDLAIAATAQVEGVPLLTYDLADFAIISGLADARRP